VLILINIDVTGLCNETCNYCPRSHGYPNTKDYMSVELFQKFVDDVNAEGFTGHICWSGRGENSLHPKFEEMVKILHHSNRKYKTRILTNGYKLKQRKWLFKRFDNVIMNTYTHRGDFQWRKEYFTHTMAGHPVQHRFWDQSVKPEEWAVTPIQVQNRIEVYKGIIATDNPAINLPCSLPATKAWIHWDGTIQLCCNDWTDTNIFGNIKDDNIFEVWRTHPKLREMRENLMKGNRSLYNVCSRCNKKHSKLEHHRWRIINENNQLLHT
jgi:MoaA/NifB/PqqE/SkfB family radical SAM enzyme